MVGQAGKVERRKSREFTAFPGLTKTHLMVAEKAKIRNV